MVIVTLFASSSAVIFGTLPGPKTFTALEAAVAGAARCSRDALTTAGVTFVPSEHVASVRRVNVALVGVDVHFVARPPTMPPVSLRRRVSKLIRASRKSGRDAPFAGSKPAGTSIVVRTVVVDWRPLVGVADDVDPVVTQPATRGIEPRTTRDEMRRVLPGLILTPATRCRWETGS